MRLSVNQINQIHTVLQEYPDTTLVVLRPDSDFGSAVFADYYKHTKLTTLTRELLGTIEITETGTW
jgi:hypothetical protein